MRLPAEPVNVPEPPPLWVVKLPGMVNGGVQILLKVESWLTPRTFSIPEVIAPLSNPPAPARDRSG